MKGFNDWRMPIEKKKKERGTDSCRIKNRAGPILSVKGRH
jgi:hypothetical protein